MGKSMKIWVKFLSCSALLLVSGVGCASPGVPAGHVSLAVAPYRPAVDVASLDLPFPQVEADEPVESAEPGDAVEAADDGAQDQVEPKVGDSSDQEAPPTGVVGRSPLRHGDRLVINLHVLESTMVQEQVDESGHISLPYIGSVKVVGMSTAEAEREIRRIYVDVRKIYKTLEVSVRAEAEEFFVSGQVQRPGKYVSLAGEKTLLQAIAEAGGFTPYANQKKVRIIRSGTKESEFHNAERIRSGRDKDPLIGPGDQIIVPRKWA